MNNSTIKHTGFVVERIMIMIFIVFTCKVEQIFFQSPIPNELIHQATVASTSTFLEETDKHNWK